MKGLKDSVSGVSHMIGALIALIGLVILVAFSTYYGSLINIISYSVFGISMVLLYTASASYHLIKTDSTLLRKLDHIMIFVLIAGTYTPILLGPLYGTLSIVMLIILWTLVLEGIFIKIFWINAHRWISSGIYLAMGWSAVFIIYPMIKTFNELHAMGNLIWLLLGGLFYTVGGIVYGLKKPDFKSKYFGFHEFFHICILFGTISHFIFILSLLFI